MDTSKLRRQEVRQDFNLKNPIGRMSQIEISVSYTLGGMNYFTGDRHPRSYRLHCSPCNINGGIRESVILGNGRESGLAYRICETNRYSEKKLKDLAIQIDAQKIADWYEEGNDKAILDYLSALKK